MKKEVFMDVEKLKRSDLQENIIIIRINKSYREDMSALELYDVTRGCWERKLESVEKAEYAFSVVYGIVKEVYKIDRWFPADQINRETVEEVAEYNAGRIAFEGSVADESIRSKYVEKSVADLFKRGEANPLKMFFKDTVNLDAPTDINVAVKPAMEIQTDGEPIVACPNCEYLFGKAPRCPECGQLIQYGKEKWNKSKLADLDAWEKAANPTGVTAKEIADFVRRICSEEDFSYHVGAVDLAIDISAVDNAKSVKAVMIFGSGPCGAFQPKELIDYLARYELDEDIATWYMDVMKPYLTKNQKNVPYERLNGYYYFNFSTIVEKQDEILSVFKGLRDRLKSGKPFA